MDDKMSVNGLLAVLAVCASVVACTWIIKNEQIRSHAMEHGLHQNSEGHWVASVSAETEVETHSSDCRGIAPPRLPAAAPGPELVPVPIPLDAGESHFQQREAVHRVDY